MKTKQLKIAVVGAGGIGGISAAHFEKAGHDVYVVDVNPELIKKVNSNGILVSGQTEFYSYLKIHNTFQPQSEKFDIIFIATKACALDKVIKTVSMVLAKDGVVVSLQNGICENRLLSVFGPKKVLGCVVGWGATVNGPGEFEMTSKGDFTIGKLKGEKVNHYNNVVKILESVVPVVQTDNIYGHLYAKLIINSCITTLGAI